MSGGYLFTELGFRDGFRGGFQGGFGVQIFESPHEREPKTVLDSGFHAVDFQIPVLDSSFFKKIGTWISDSSCWWDSEFIELDSGFQRPGFRIPQANLFRIPDSSNKTFHPYIRVIRIMLPK